MCLIGICPFGREQFGPLTKIRISHHELGSILINVLDNAGNGGDTGDPAGFHSIVTGNNAVFTIIKGAYDYRSKQSVFLYGLSQFMQFKFAVHFERLIFPWDELIYRYFFFGILNSIVRFEEVRHVKFAGVA